MGFRDNDHAALARAQALQQQLEEKERELHEAQERIERLEHAADAIPESDADPSLVTAPPQPSPTPEPAEPFLNPYLVGMALLFGPVFGWFLLPGYAMDLRPDIGILCGVLAAVVTLGWLRRRGDGFVDAIVRAILAMLVVGHAALLLVHVANRLLDDSAPTNEVGRVAALRTPGKGGRLMISREGHADPQAMSAAGNYAVGDPVYLVVRQGFFGLEWSPEFASTHPPRPRRK